MDSAHEAGTPSAGDGVCPLEEHFDSTAAAAYQRWRRSIAAAAPASRESDLFGQLTDLLHHVPPFRAAPSAHFASLEGPLLQIKCRSEWLTTEDSTCDVPWKGRDHYQVIGIPNPLAYEYTQSSETQTWREVTQSQPGLISRFFLAWTYILSCRWVETLQQTGGQAEWRQGEEIGAHNFWEIVLSHGWRASFTRNDRTWYAPWSLRKNGSAAAATKNLPPASPHSASAIEILGGFCTSEELRRQSLAALVAVLVMIDPMDSTPIKLPEPGPSPEHGDRIRSPGIRSFDGFLPQLDKCITLNCSPEGVLSLLCAVFFDPTIPSNLVGAQMTGAMEAIAEIKGDRHTLLSALSRQCPRVALLWPAAICSGKLEGILRLAEGGTPPLNVPLATWTGILQSFVQAYYPSVDIGEGWLLRASEFTLTWLISPNVNAPFAPSPPFGTTSVKENLNIETRKHLGHNHRLMEYKMHWILELGGELSGYDDARVIVHAPKVQLADQSFTALGGKTYHRIDNVACASESATMNLFQWYQSLEEGGLWLGGGAEGRRTLNHYWISVGCANDDDEQASSEGQISDDAPHEVLDTLPIEQWLNG